MNWFIDKYWQLINDPRPIWINFHVMVVLYFVFMIGLEANKDPFSAASLWYIAGGFTAFLLGYVHCGILDKLHSN